MMAQSSHPSGYPHAVIGNGRSAALVAPDATVEFLCLPDFDSPFVFASLLDPERGGRFGLAIEGGSAVEQAYLPRTNILRTRFESPAGAFECLDFMPRWRLVGDQERCAALSGLVRVLRRLHGRPRVRVDYRPRPLYGIADPLVRLVAPGVVHASAAGHAARGDQYESVYLYSDLDLDAALAGRPQTLAGDAYLWCSYHDKLERPTLEKAELALARTHAYWLGFCADGHVPGGPWKSEIERSTLALKLMQFEPTGAVIAAPTTSLPEELGGERNWDYRFCWIRDASMTVSVLRRLGHRVSATRFLRWLMQISPGKDDALQIMYGIRGERLLTEHAFGHLSGYGGSRPVRIGNGAYHQRQHDIHGALMDCIWQGVADGLWADEELEGVWTRVRTAAAAVARAWERPDSGIWEFRGDKRHFVHSKLLCWVAVDRAMRIAERLGRPDWAARRRPLADAIRTAILREGWNARLGAFTQSFGSDTLDASVLLMADLGLLSPDDPRFVSTVRVLRDGLMRDGLMYRYRAPDDFGLPASSFTLCTLWMAKALWLVGEKDEARATLRRVLACANPHGLLSEDIEFGSGRLLGNFPQAYSHLAVIDCALAFEGSV